MSDLPEFEYPEWMSSAACRGMAVDLFFPERSEDAAQAKAVCEGCAVRVECLEYALANGETFECWGGLTERARNRIRSRRRVPVRPVVSGRACGEAYGTVGGYSRHLRANDPACGACREAHSASVQASRARGRVSVAEWRAKDDARRLQVVSS